MMVTCNHRRSRGGYLAGAIIVLTMFVAQFAVATEVSVDSVKKLSELEKEQLLEKQEWFEKLPQAEKERIRKLHQQISSHEKSERLIRILEQYNEWLKTLSASRRAEILALPKDERIEAIRQEMERRKRFRFLRYSNLTREDQELITSWLNDYVAANRERLLRELPPSILKLVQEKLKPGKETNLFILTNVMMRRRGREPRVDLTPLLEGEEFKSLLSRLSDKARAEYEEANDDSERERIAHQWFRLVMMQQMAVMPKVKEEVLIEFFKTLPANDRRELEMLGRDRMFHELARLYFMSNMSDFRRRSGRPDRFRGPPRGGFSDRGEDHRPERHPPRGPGEELPERRPPGPPRKDPPDRRPPRNQGERLEDNLPDVQ